MTKNYILLLLVFCIPAAHSQIIDIPDVHFKARLLASGPTDGVARDANDQYLVVDTNNNGEIEVSEALPVRKLEIPGDEIADLTGIAAFANLTDLNINNNYLTSLDVSMLLQLKWLLADYNQISSLSVGPGLEFLGCGNNQLTSLDVSNCNALQNIHCNNNQLATLDLSNKPNLNTIFCFRNVLTNLNIANSPNISTIWCSENLLFGIDLSDAPTLSWLECDHNQITSLDLSNIALPEWSIFFLYCNDNLFSSLDLSVANSRVVADCSNNPDLAFINCMGTGTFYDPNAHEPPYPGLFFQNLPSLMHICADAVNYEYLDDKILMYGYTGVTVDATCTLQDVDFAINDLAVYPNPVSDVFYIHSNEKVDAVDLYNIFGQLVLSAICNQKEFSIDGSKLASGNYFVKVQSGTSISWTQLIKQ
ncbi:T9SS type A sorting domain-containing protein [Flavobacterium sp.]|uniref:T9SS type A sorting domain-containing protein n=1 Tax=Flavobacterium sp. TaxID=239 RepID=UPI0039E41514